MIDCELVGRVLEMDALEMDALEMDVNDLRRSLRKTKRHVTQVFVDNFMCCD